MSISLLAGVLYGALVALLLLGAPHNRAANRFLAALIGVLALRVLPYAIGYAGYYDAYPWLSFAPYNLSLAIGPLVYCYVVALTGGAAPARAARHFAPAALQFAYYCALFVRPVAWKTAWDGAVHRPLVDPLETWLALASMAVYLGGALRHYRAHQRWLAQNTSRSEDFRMAWLRNFLLALGATLVAWALLAALARVGNGLDYFQQFPLYLWLALLVCYLGTQGQRANAEALPRPQPEPEPERESAPVYAIDHAATRMRAAAPAYAQARASESEPAPEPALAYASDPASAPASEALIAPAIDVAGAPTVPDAPQPPPERDWRGQGERWRQQISDGQWWRDPALTLATTARRLGTNTTHLSRAINDGLALNFNELVNGMRVAEVQRRLADPAERGELIAIALDAGFSSKASFNRAFKAHTGMTPSAFRATSHIPHPANDM